MNQITRSIPHDIWSSEEDEDAVVEVSTKPPKKVVKKIIKVVRGHRNEQNELTTTLQIEPTTSTTTTTTTRTVPTTENFASDFFSPVKDNRKLIFATTERTTRFRGITTTPSPRRDLSATRNVVERQKQKDNARDFDEDTDNSPFDDARDIVTTTEAVKEEKTPEIEFQEDEDIEEVISKLSARRPEIRRSPVRNSIPVSQFEDKTNETPSIFMRDGVKTFESIDAAPIDVITIGANVENNKETHLDELVAMMDQEVKSTKHSEEAEEEEKERVTSEIPTTTTSIYDPMQFYKTPRPKMARKETILRFCSKDNALRDQSNMVIACGSELEEWTPSRCPENSDCFMSHDSLYRICCPVHRG